MERLFVFFVLANLLRPNLFIRASDDPMSEVDLEITSEIESSWDFEPRVWTPEELPPTVDDFDFGPEITHQDAANVIPDEPAKRQLREKSYYYESRAGQLFRANKSNSTRISTRQQQETKVKCDQFRVDIRETVICDRQRCDKLDFEWPRHDNQMIMVQTTKEGMRFYQAHLEFKPPQLRKLSTEKLNARPNATSSQQKMPIKFDILDFFKPKPTQAPATTPTTSTPIPPVTEPGLEASTITSPSSITTSPAREQPIDAMDNNQTQLMTTFRLDTRRRVQKVLGFGGALTDSSCRNIKSLSPTMSKSLMEDYYGPRGLQYSLVRMSMGSSDFSITPYTNNDKPYEGGSRAINSDRRDILNETDDVEMKYFHLTDEDFEYKLPMARQAIATSRQELKFYSSLWSPPIWMKNNSHIVHGSLKGDVYGPYYKALADLIIKWLEAYRKQGIEFWGTTGLNEPVTGVKPFIFHNSLGMTRDEYVTWIKLYLGPMLRQRGFENIKLMAVDDNKGLMQNWAGGLLGDKEVAKYISGIAIHWYMNDDYENLNFLVDRHPDKFLLSSEACNGYYPFQVHVLPGNWDRGMAYMLDIMKLMHKNVVAWVDWNMALNVNGGPSWAGNYVDSPVLVNAERDEYYKSPTFYALGHYSHFVVPGSYRLDHRLANARYDYPLEASGFYTPNDYVVVVALNANRHPVPFKVIVDRQLVRVVTLREESFNTIIFKWKKAGA